MRLKARQKGTYVSTLWDSMVAMESSVPEPTLVVFARLLGPNNFKLFKFRKWKAVILQNEVQIFSEKKYHDSLFSLREGMAPPRLKKSEFCSEDLCHFGCHFVICKSPFICHFVKALFLRFQNPKCCTISKYIAICDVAKAVFLQTRVTQKNNSTTLPVLFFGLS